MSHTHHRTIDIMRTANTSRSRTELGFANTSNPISKKFLLKTSFNCEANKVRDLYWFPVFHNNIPFHQTLRHSWNSSYCKQMNGSCTQSDVASEIGVGVGVVVLRFVATKQKLDVILHGINLHNGTLGNIVLDVLREKRSTVAIIASNWNQFAVIKVPPLRRQIRIQFVMTRTYVNEGAGQHQKDAEQHG